MLHDQPSELICQVDIREVHNIVQHDPRLPQRLFGLGNSLRVARFLGLFDMLVLAFDDA
jgi:hypothetical protein